VRSTPSSAHPSRRWIPPAAFALATAGVVIAAVLMAASTRAETHHRAGAALDTVAALKVNAIEEWRGDHRRNARLAATYPTVREAVAAAARGTLSTALRAHVTAILRHLAEIHGYARIALLDASGRELVGWARAGAETQPFDPQVIRGALRPPDAADALSVDARLRPHLEVAVAAHGPDVPAGVLAIRLDASPIFDEVLERWPVPSGTANAGLVLRRGDEVLLFVPRRAAPEGTSVRRFPLSERHRPAVRAALGETGVISAVDSLGVPVLVAIRGIPGWPWKVRARVDVSEIDAPLASTLALIFGLVAALLLAGGLLLAAWWRGESARGAMDAQLRDSQERFELALSGTHRVWDWDLVAGRMETYAPSGGAPETIAGTVEEVLEALVHRDDLSRVRALAEAHLRGETAVFEAEHRVARAAAGQVRWALTRGRVSRRDARGRPIRFTGVASDVTERRAMQARLELAQRMAGLGTLAAGVAHEINNPLASLSANVDFLAAEDVTAGRDPDVAAALRDARDAAERVRDVVQNLQRFSRPGPGGRAPTDVRAELEAALRLANNEIRHRARVEVRVGALPLVDAGGHELGQVFLNLLVNAAQAIPEGDAASHLIRVDAGTDELGRARIEIGDTGSGIAPELLERIFDPFFTTKPHGGGTGLGLAIAHRIVVDAGGEIFVESTVGRGSTFRVVFPPSRAAGDAAPASPVIISAAPAPRRRLLVVDDDALVVRALVRSLSQAYDVEGVGSAADALARLDVGPRFDTVLCDLMMPQMTGMELHARVAARDPALAARMVFITGGAFSAAATDFLARTRNTCIEKPFETARLRDAISRVLAA
jgi:PAS domain S-box-containing protein